MSLFDQFDFEPDESLPVVQQNPIVNKNQDFEFETEESPSPINSYKAPIKDSSPIDYKKHALRSLSRAAETIVGLPGDLQNLIKSGFQFGLEKLGGEKGKLFSQAMEKAPRSSTLPSSSQLRDLTKDKFNNYLEPSNEAENIADEFISDIASLAIPVKGKIPFLRSIGTALAGNVAKQTTKAFDANEEAQTASKLGAFFLAGLTRRKNANEFVKNLYEESKSQLPKGTMLPTSSLVNRLNQTEIQLKKGLSTSTKKEVLSKVKELKNKSAGGSIPAEDLIQSYHDINESMLSKKLFEDLNKTEQRLLRSRFDLLKSDINKSIEDYGQYNPKFLDSWKSANQAHAAIQQSKKVSKIIGKVIKAKPSIAASPALALFEFSHPGALPATAAAVGVGYGAMKSGEVLYQLSKSPSLQKHYLSLLKDASADNVTGVIKNLEKMNKEISQKDIRNLRDQD